MRWEWRFNTPMPSRCFDVDQSVILASLPSNKGLARQLGRQVVAGYSSPCIALPSSLRMNCCRLKVALPSLSRATRQPLALTNNSPIFQQPRLSTR